ncbi:MAG: NAD-dependent epimerase/dehydratase family protein [bacterium]|nr:NAD-dependent epimerase/dehydratase family protein [bacterium]
MSALRKVLVTGATGLVGFNIVEALKRRGAEIRCLARTPAKLTSRGMNHFFADLRDRKIPLLLPGGLPLAYAPDVGEGHVLAAEKAEIGDRFILSDQYFTLVEMAQRVAAVVGLKKTPTVLPLWVGTLVSEAGEMVSKLTRRPPLIPRGQLHLLQWGAKPQATRARDELGWRMTPFEEGLKRTMEFLDRAAQS